jgi:hypothetical protein
VHWTHGDMKRHLVPSNVDTGNTSRVNFHEHGQWPEIYPSPDDVLGLNTVTGPVAVSVARYYLTPDGCKSRLCTFVNVRRRPQNHAEKARPVVTSIIVPGQCVGP